MGSEDASEELLLDPTDACNICFEKAKNAVILKCGHGGCCTGTGSQGRACGGVA